MTWRWRICSNEDRRQKTEVRIKPASRRHNAGVRGRGFHSVFSLLSSVFFWYLSLLPMPAAQLRGQVELTNSKDPAVRRDRDYTGVVLWLEPVGRPAPAANAETRRNETAG
jgi:hypothetical protein